MIKVKAGQPNQMISSHTQLTLIPFLLVIFPLGMCGCNELTFFTYLIYIEFENSQSKILTLVFCI